MNPFEQMDRVINRILLFLVVCAILIFLFSCSNKVTYEIYLEHQPQEPLYITNSESDAQDYYNEYKQYHSDMYITKK
jgi:hypothetical protein